jgi:hypothetical protein
VRAFFDFLCDRLVRERDLFEGRYSHNTRAHNRKALKKSRIQIEP